MRNSWTAWPEMTGSQPGRRAAADMGIVGAAFHAAEDGGQLAQPMRRLPQLLEQRHFLRPQRAEQRAIGQRLEHRPRQFPGLSATAVFAPPQAHQGPKRRADHRHDRGQHGGIVEGRPAVDHRGGAAGGKDQFPQGGEVAVGADPRGHDEAAGRLRLGDRQALFQEQGRQVPVAAGRGVAGGDVIGQGPVDRARANAAVGRIADHGVEPAAVDKLVQRGAHQGIAAAKVAGPSRNSGFARHGRVEPQAGLGQGDGPGIQIDAVEAMLDDATLQQRPRRCGGRAGRENGAAAG